MSKVVSSVSDAAAAAVRPIRVRCLMRDQRGHVLPVQQVLGESAQFNWDEAWDPGAIAPDDTDIVICVNEFQHDVVRCLDAARQQGIPSLLIQDGTLEWRCQYENPRFGFGGGAPQHQPVVADKIACIGGVSARHISAWGNADKVEVTGMPRLDYLSSQYPQRPQPPGRSKRLAVVTAKKPWFTEAQGRVVLESLNDLRDHLDRHPEIEVTWRVTRGLKDLLGVENSLKTTEGVELVEVLEGVDAVVCTPSTAVLEAMLLRLPVAVLDYHNTPSFLPSAWRIDSKQHLDVIGDELFSPAASRMLFQEVCLHDALSCEEASAPRVARLIERMVEIGAECRDGGENLRIPRQLIGNERFIENVPPDLAALYPGQGAFASDDVADLQVRLARLSKDYEAAKGELGQRRAGYWMSKLGQFAAGQVKKLPRRIKRSK